MTPQNLHNVSAIQEEIKQSEPSLCEHLMEVHTGTYISPAHLCMQHLHTVSKETVHAPNKLLGVRTSYDRITRS